MRPAPPEQVKEPIQEAGEQRFKHESPLSKVRILNRDSVDWWYNASNKGGLSTQLKNVLLIYSRLEHMNAGIQKKHILIALGVSVIVGVAWYALSPLFDNKVVNDDLPVVVPIEKESTEATPSIAVGESDPNRETAPVISGPFPIVDTPAHPASGVVRIVRNAGETILRYENYKTINGPDVRVYLAKDLAAKEYVDLGPIKGTEGNINYTVPKGIDISQYRYALTWCEDFSVLFNSAEISVTK